MCFSDVNHFAKIISGGFSPERRRGGGDIGERSGAFAATNPTQVKKTLKKSGLQRGKYFPCGVAPSSMRSAMARRRAKNPSWDRPTSGGKIAPEKSVLRKTARIFSRRTAGKTKPAAFPRRVFVPAMRLRIGCTWCPAPARKASIRPLSRQRSA
jgi:hypothetical protein